MTESTEPEVRFGELPPHSRGAGVSQYAAVAAVLRGRPGEWAIIKSVETRLKATRTAHNLRREAKPFRAGADGFFEFASRDCDVWARFIGTGS